MVLIKKKKKTNSELYSLEILTLKIFYLRGLHFLTSSLGGSDTGDGLYIKLETSWGFNYSSQYNY